MDTSGLLPPDVPETKRLWCVCCPKGSHLEATRHITSLLPRCPFICYSPPFGSFFEGFILMSAVHAIRQQRHAHALTAPDSSGCQGTVAQVIAQALVDAGVRHVFGGHGAAVAPIISAICAHPDLRWICTRNENNASLAAAGMAKLTGGLACCVATSGPGATNLTTGLVDAAADFLPVLAITGLKARRDLGCVLCTLNRTTSFWIFRFAILKGTGGKCCNLCLLFNSLALDAVRTAPLSLTAMVRWS